MKSSLAGGYSGSLVREVSDGVIEKQVTDIEDSPRLRAQCKMQRDFATMLGLGSIRVPGIIGGKEVTYIDRDGRPTVGLQSFSMQKVDGTPAFLVRGNSLPDRLAEFVCEMAESSVMMKPASRAFRAKILSVMSSDAIQGSNDCYQLGQKLLQEWPEMDEPMPHGLYHGDLTLCNMIVDGGLIYLFDFTPQLVPSVLFDMVKLRQDTEHGWFRNVFPVPGPDEMMDDKMKEWDRRFVDAFSKYEWFKRYYQPVQALNLYRIIPYAYAQSDYSVVNELSDKITECICSF